MTELKIAVVMPVYNDWQACRVLVAQLDRILAARHLRHIPILIVDDGTQDLETVGALGDGYACVEPIVLQLRRNLGHQRAICIGLAYAHETISPDVTVVMDSDGEDSADDVPRLLDAVQSHSDAIVFARRTKRSESYLFRIGYALFKGLHRLATGHGIAFGNFSAIPRVRLASLLSVGDLWNNYAASVLVSKQRYTSIPTVRGTRLEGQPRMNFTALVAHGLSAISVFGEIVAIRLALGGAIVAMLTTGGLLLSVAGLVGLALPVLVLLAMLSLACVQLIGFALLFAFITLSRRSAPVFQPTRDSQFYIQCVVRPSGVPVQAHGHE